MMFEELFAEKVCKAATEGAVQGPVTARDVDGGQTTLRGHLLIGTALTSVGRETSAVNLKVVSDTFQGSTLHGPSRRRRLKRDQPASAFFSSSLTTFGLAFPWLAFMAWPTRNPNVAPRPPRYCATAS